MVFYCITINSQVNSQTNFVYNLLFGSFVKLIIDGRPSEKTGNINNRSTMQGLGSPYFMFKVSKKYYSLLLAATNITFLSHLFHFFIIYILSRPMNNFPQ